MQAVICPICEHPVPRELYKDHTVKCAKRKDMEAIVEDTDKIFLRIDYSATNKMMLLMQGRRMEQQTGKGRMEAPGREERKDLSNNLLMLMYPSVGSTVLIAKKSVSGGAEEGTVAGQGAWGTQSQPALRQV